MRTVTNSTRADGRAFLEEAVAAGVRTRVRTWPLAECNAALAALEHDAIRGAGVLVVGGRAGEPSGLAGVPAPGACHPCPRPPPGGPPLSGPPDPG